VQCHNKIFKQRAIIIRVKYYTVYCILRTNIRIVVRKRYLLHATILNDRHKCRRNICLWPHTDLMSLKLSVIQHKRRRNHLTCLTRQRYTNGYNFRQIIRCKKKSLSNGMYQWNI